MADDRELFVHKEWLGLIQLVGLVVTARSLIKVYNTHIYTQSTLTGRNNYANQYRT